MGCVIRQLMYKHSIIDCYPRLLDRDDASLASHNSAPPDTCESSISSDERPASGIDDNGISLQASMDSNKLSQDVLIFKKIAQLMPPKQLLRLLSGVEHVSKHSPQVEATCKATSDANEQKRKIRFAENANGQVNCLVHEVPRLTDPDLWWQANEFSSIRYGCQSLVQHYTLYQDDYIKAIKRIMDISSSSSSSSRSAKRLERDLECVLRNGICRGLESHIVRSCREACRKHRRNVLRAQKEVYKSLDEGCEQIRRASCASSASFLQLSNQLAQLDARQVSRGGGARLAPRIPGLDRWSSM